MSKIVTSAHPYGEIFVERVVTGGSMGITTHGWRISPVLAPLPGTPGGSEIFGNPKVASEPGEAYYEAINKARNVVKDGNVERVAIRGRTKDLRLIDLAVVVSAEIAKDIRDPESCFIQALIPPVPK